MNFFPELNIVIDLLIKKRKGHSLARKVFNLLKVNGYRIWQPASNIPDLQFILIKAATFYKIDQQLILLELKKWIAEVSLFSITGNAIKSNIDRLNNIESLMTYSSFKTNSPNGIIISNTDKLKHLPDVITPDKFLKDYSKNGCQKNEIAMLDLEKDYHFLVEELDNSLLKIMPEANYILGPELKDFESKVSEYLRVKHCIGVSSGTDALVLSLKALAVKTRNKEYFDQSDKIITTAFTFRATADAIFRTGATPVFIDVDPKTYNIDCKKLKDYLNSRPSNVVGIIPVHLFGQSCDMDEILDIAAENRLFVLEDVAQAFGGSWKQARLGSLGDIAAFSFYPSKNLAALGDAGMISTKDEELYAVIRKILTYGVQDKNSVEYIGYNSRLDNIQAAILLIKLNYIDQLNQRRQRSAQIYSRELSGISAIETPYCLPDANHVFHQYTIRVLNKSRNLLQAYLKEHGIMSAIYYPVPLHKMKVYNLRSEIFSDLKITEQLSLEVLSLPIGPFLTPGEVLTVTKTIVDKILY